MRFALAAGSWLFPRRPPPQGWELPAAQTSQGPPRPWSSEGPAPSPHLLLPSALRFWQWEAAAGPRKKIKNNTSHESLPPHLCYPLPSGLESCHPILPAPPPPLWALGILWEEEGSFSRDLARLEVWEGAPEMVGVQEHMSSSNVLWALVSSAGVTGGSAIPQSWLQQWGKKGWKRPTKSSSLTHVHISLEGGLRALGMESGRGDDKHCARERWARTTHLHTPPCGPACQVSCLMCTCFHPSARLGPPRCRGTAGGGSVPEGRQYHSVMG